MHSAALKIQFEDKITASIVYSALLPELTKNIPQTKTELHQSDTLLTLNISAETTSVLRAAFNSYSRWIQTAIEIQKCL